MERRKKTLCCVYSGTMLLPVVMNVFNFENNYAAYCGTSHARTISNGSNALFLSMIAVGINRTIMC